MFSKFTIKTKIYVIAGFAAFYLLAGALLGNNSIKLWLDGYHAHNAYIEVIATNGVFIALLYFTLIYRNIRKSNWVYVIPILIFGLTQYGFFWGISLMDILFYVILFKTISDSEANPSLIEPIPL